MNSTENSITEQQIATSYKIASGPYTLSELWSIVFEDYGGDIGAVHAKLTERDQRARRFRNYAAMKVSGDFEGKSWQQAAEEIEIENKQMRRYLRAVSAAAVLAQSNGIIISPNNALYRNQSPVYAQNAR